MAEFPEGFDLEALLAPISAEAPAGSDLREDSSPGSLYYRLRDARAEARAAEREMDAADPDRAAADTSATPPQWRTIRELAIEATQGRSKDLEIAAWLTEALLRSDGLAGLSAGCKLMTGLVEGFWDGLFPLPDEEGISTRVAPVAGLNGIGGEGTLIQPIRKLALFNRPSGDAVPFFQYEQSAELAAIADPTRRQQRLDAGVLPIETVNSEAAVAERLAGDTGGPGFAELARHAGDAAAAWQALSSLARRARWRRRAADQPGARPPRTVRHRRAHASRRVRRPRGRPPRTRSNRIAGAVPGAPARLCRRRHIARGSAALARPARRFLPPHRAALAARLHPAGGGAPRPHDLARTPRRDRPRRRRRARRS